MGLFKYVGNEPSDYVDYVHHDGQGEGRKTFQPGETIEALSVDSPDFVEVGGDPEVEAGPEAVAD